MLKKLLLIFVLVFGIVLFGCNKEDSTEEDTNVTLKDRYYYNYNSLDDLVIESKGIKEVKEFKLGETEIKNILVKDNKLIVSGSLVKQKGYGEHIATCKINDKGYSFIVEIVDNRLPQYKGENEIRYTGSDVVLGFELYTGKIVSLTGEGISEGTYEIKGDEIIIYAQTLELLKKADNVITYKLSYVDINEQKVKEISGDIHIKKTIYGPPVFD